MESAAVCVYLAKKWFGCCWHFILFVVRCVTVVHHHQLIMLWCLSDFLCLLETAEMSEQQRHETLHTKFMLPPSVSVLVY